MGNSYLKRAAKGLHGTKSEGKLSKRLGGRLTPASGALEGIKGDIILPDYLLEAKCTVKGSISLKLEWLLKISDEALHVSKSPALAITFVNHAGTPKVNGSWVMIKESEFKDLGGVI